MAERPACHPSYRVFKVLGRSLKDWIKLEHFDVWILLIVVEGEQQQDNEIRRLQEVTTYGNESWQEWVLLQHLSLSRSNSIASDCHAKKNSCYLETSTSLVFRSRFWFRTPIMGGAVEDLPLPSLLQIHFNQVPIAQFRAYDPNLRVLTDHLINLIWKLWIDIMLPWMKMCDKFQWPFYSWPSDWLWTSR